MGEGERPPYSRRRQAYITSSSFISVRRVSDPMRSTRITIIIRFFPGGSDVKESAYNAEDSGSIPGSGRSLEKEMATHSSVLALKIPWTEEPGRPQSMGSQRVRHD